MRFLIGDDNGHVKSLRIDSRTVPKNSTVDVEKRDQILAGMGPEPVTLNKSAVASVDGNDASTPGKLNQIQRMAVRKSDGEENQ